MNLKQHVWGWKRWTDLKKEIWKFIAVYYGWSHGGEYTGSNRSYLMKMRFMDSTLSNSDIYMAPKKKKKHLLENNGLSCWKPIEWSVMKSKLPISAQTCRALGSPPYIKKKLDKQNIGDFSWTQKKTEFAGWIIITKSGESDTSKELQLSRFAHLEQKTLDAINQ